MSSDSSKEVASQLWRVRRTCSQMLRDRDFVVMEDDLNMKSEEFFERFSGGASGIRYVVEDFRKLNVRSNDCELL